MNRIHAWMCGAVLAAAAAGCANTESQARQDAKDRQILQLTEEKHRLEQQLAQEQAKNAALAAQQQRLDALPPAPPKAAPRKGPELPAGLRDKGVSSATVDGRPALRIPGTILFAPGQAVLGASAQGLLKQVAEQIRKSPGAIRVAGHTDSDPIVKSRYKSNQELSEARAKAVRDALVAGGIERARLEVVGYGDDKPIASNKTSDGKRQNRRVELILLGD
jgi:flagellar motor protein MotB